jgi:hypothetical protein
VFLKPSKQWTVDANFTADGIFRPFKNFGGDILRTFNLFSAAFVRPFCGVSSESQKACGFEKHGFQNHKAAANMGFCASWA